MIHIYNLGPVSAGGGNGYVESEEVFGSFFECIYGVLGIRALAAEDGGFCGGRYSDR